MGSPSIVRVHSIRISWLPIDKPKPRQMFSGHSRTSAWSTVVSHSRPCDASMIGNPEAEPLDLSISPADFVTMSIRDTCAWEAMSLMMTVPPRPGKVLISPWARMRFNAARMVAREANSVSARARSEGSLSPMESSFCSARRWMSQMARRTAGPGVVLAVMLIRTVIVPRSLFRWCGCARRVPHYARKSCHRRNWKWPVCRRPRR